MVSPIRIEVYNRYLQRLGAVGNPTAFKATPRHNVISTLEFTVANDHPRFRDLLSEGAVVRVLYDGVAGPLISGPIRKVSSSLASQEATFSVQDFLLVIYNMLGWAAPTVPLSAQNALEDVRVGPGETVAKGLIADNARRLGLPITVAPDQARGLIVYGAWRMKPLADVLLNVLNASGVGLTVQLAEPVPLANGGFGSPGLVVDCYSPRTYPRSLSDEAGTVVDWTYEREAPAATRWVLGATGEGAARQFFGDVDTAAEALWGPLNVSERFLDASQVGSELADAQETYAKAQADLPGAEADYQSNPSQSTQDALNHVRFLIEQGPGLIAAATTKRDQDLAAAFAAARQEGAATSGLSVTLAETSTVRYGDKGLLRGDLIPIRFGEQSLSAQMSECTFSWTKDDGLLVTPVVGKVTSPIRQLFSALGALRRDRKVA